jgi:hypothetical protein
MLTAQWGQHCSCPHPLGGRGAWLQGGWVCTHSSGEEVCSQRGFVPWCFLACLHCFPVFSSTLSGLFLRVFWLVFTDSLYCPQCRLVCSLVFLAWRHCFPVLYSVSSCLFLSVSWLAPRYLLICSFVFSGLDLDIVLFTTGCSLL